MKRLRLRVLKRHTSLEVDLEQFFKTEFLNREGQPDTSLSIFEITHESLVQTHAEFLVSHLSPPAKSRGGLSLDGYDDGESVACPGDTLFNYTIAQHLELRFLNEAELRGMVEWLYRERLERKRSSSASEVVAYGADRLAAADAEWVDACERRPKWLRELAKSRSKGSAGTAKIEEPRELQDE